VRNVESYPDRCSVSHSEGYPEGSSENCPENCGDCCSAGSSADSPANRSGSSLESSPADSSENRPESSWESCCPDCLPNHLAGSLTDSRPQLLGQNNLPNSMRPAPGLGLSLRLGFPYKVDPGRQPAHVIRARREVQHPSSADVQQSSAGHDE